MFRGRFECKIDEKGRLNLPSAYRQAQVAKKYQSYVITNSLVQSQHCLDVYTLSEWHKLEKRIQRLPQLKTQVQAYQRFYLSAGQVVEVDANGRLLLPLGLRKYAELGNEVVCVGMGEKFEIWASEQWQSLQEQLIQQYEEILNVVADLEGEKK